MIHLMTIAKCKLNVHKIGFHDEKYWLVFIYRARQLHHSNWNSIRSQKKLSSYHVDWEIDFTVFTLTEDVLHKSFTVAFIRFCNSLFVLQRLPLLLFFERSKLLANSMLKEFLTTWESHFYQWCNGARLKSASCFYSITRDWRQTSCNLLGYIGFITKFMQTFCQTKLNMFLNKSPCAADFRISLIKHLSASHISDFVVAKLFCKIFLLDSARIVCKRTCESH